MVYKFKGSEIITLLEKDIKRLNDNLAAAQNTSEPNQNSINSITEEIRFNTYKIAHINSNLEYDVDGAELTKLYDLSKLG